MAGAIEAAKSPRGGIAQCEQAARHPGDRDAERSGFRHARQRPAGGGRNAQAHGGRRSASIWRGSPTTASRHRAPAAARRLRAGAGDPAGRRVPSGDDGGRGDAGERLAAALAGARTGRGPVLRRRRVRPAACRRACRLRRRQRRRRRGGAAPRGGEARLEAVVPRDLFRQPLQPAELSRFDAVLFDPPRAGRGAPGARIAAEPGADASSPSPATPRPSRATRAFSSTAAMSARASRPLTSSATRPMSRSSRPSAAPRRKNAANGVLS